MKINPSQYVKLTMGAWVKPSSADPVRQVLSCDNCGYDRSLGIDYRGGGIGWSAFCGSQQVLGFKGVVLEAWVFLAVVYDQTAGTVKLYAGNYAPLNKSSCTLYEEYNIVDIGRNPGYGEYFHGAIDNVFFLGEALSEGQINYLRTTGPSALFLFARGMGPAGYIPLLFD